MLKQIIIANVLAVGITCYAAQPYQTDNDTIALWHLDEPVPATAFANSSRSKYQLKKTGKGELKSVEGILGRAITGFQPQGGKDNRILAGYLPNPPAQTFEAWLMWPDTRFLPRSSNNPRGRKVTQTLFLRTGSMMPIRCDFIHGGENGFIKLSLAQKSGAMPVTFKAPLPKIEAEEWYHFALSTEQKGNNLEAKFYLTSKNTTIVSPKPFACHIFENFKQTPHWYYFRIGESGHTGSVPFAGIIDEIRFSKIARTTFDTLKQQQGK